MRKNNAGNAAIKVIVLLVLAAAVVLGVFMIMNRSRGEKQTSEDNMVLTKLQQVTTMNLDVGYPNSERDVVATFGRIMQTLYNEEYTDKDFETMEQLLVKLYDEELIANQNDYYQQLRQEVNAKRTNGYTIQNYVTAEKNQVINSVVDGREMAMLECQFSVRNATEIQATIYQFLLRKDDQGKWKIYGWQPREDQTVDLFAASPGAERLTDTDG